jgi:hypothetical protein
MTVLSMRSPEPRVELLEDELHVHEVSFVGTVVEVAHDLGTEGDSVRLARLLADAVEIGATVLRNGQSRALVESVAAEIDRLIATTTSEGKKLPDALEGPLVDHMKRLSDLCAEYFDPKRARSVQHQLKAIVGDTTGAELRRLVPEVLGEDGALGAQLKMLSSTSTDTLGRVNALMGRIEQKLQLDQAVERSVHKGRPFEEVVQAELEAIHGPLGDDVRCVRAAYGLLPKANKGAKAGDYLVAINPEHTRGREVSYVVEAKTGPLSATTAKRELNSAMQNRGAAAGVLVFDSLGDAPLGGRCYLPHGDGRFTAVLDATDGSPLAFEVACREARLAALASVQAEGKLDSTWLQAQCDRMCEVIEAASALLRSVSRIERGASDIRHQYQEMRTQALALIDETRDRATVGKGDHAAAGQDSGSASSLRERLGR